MHASTLTALTSCEPAMPVITTALVGRGDSDRAEVEAFIRERFAAEFGATLYHFLPLLLTLRSSDGKLLAAAGLAPAGDGPLFLEQYLDGPIEQVLAERLSLSLPRQAMVEVGNLAAACAGGARLLIAAMTHHLHQQGYSYVVFTGTRTLRNAFRRLGLLPLAVARADADKMGAHAADWGRYYAEQPQVMAGPIALGERLLAASNGLPPLLLPQRHSGQPS